MAKSIGSGRITRKQFIRKSAVGAAAVGAAAIGLSGTAHAAGTAQYWPDPNYPRRTLQEAIDAAGEGGTITVQEGTWNLPATENDFQAYNLRPGQTIKGAGLDSDGYPKSKLIFTPANAPAPKPGLLMYTFGFMSNGGNVTVEELDLTGEGAYFVSPIYMENTSNVVRRNKVTTTHHAGMYLTNTSHSEFDSNTVVAGQRGIYLVGFKGPNTYDKVTGNKIVNRFTSSNFEAIRLESPAANPSHDNEISNNDLSDFLTVRQIEIRGTAYGNRIVHNKIGTAKGQGILCLGHNNVILGNVFTGSAENGIRFDNSSPINPYNNIVAGNDLTGYATSSAQVHLGGMSHDNYFGPWTDPATGEGYPGNKFGSSATAGVYCAGSDNIFEDSRFNGDYPGWEPCGAGPGLFWFTDSSSGNKAVATKLNGPPHGFDVCCQVFDQSGANDVPGHKKCPAKSPAFLQKMDDLKAKITASGGGGYSSSGGFDEE